MSRVENLVTLGAVLDMCNSGKLDADIVKDIKGFCEKSLNMDGVKS